MSSVHVPPHILPLIQRLAQEKTIEQGLLIARDLNAVQHWSTGWPGQWKKQELWMLNNLPFTQRYDLAVMLLDAEYLQQEHFQKKGDGSEGSNDVAAAHTITHGITHLRDLMARRVLVIAYGDQSDVMRALGFTLVEKIDAWELWQFNILEYKQVPDWLNSRYWANPENWDKYRW